MVPMVTMELTEPSESLDLLVILSRDLRETKDHREKLENKESRDLLELMVIPSRESLEPPELTESMDNPELREPRVKPVLRDLKVRVPNCFCRRYIPIVAKYYFGVC